MWKFRSCPKCNGDVYVDYDINGWYEECLQCGYMHDLRAIVEVKEKPREKKREIALASHHRRA